MVTEIQQNTARMSKCPSFNSCSSPKCPLDELEAKRVRLSDEPKCKATKRIRLLLGKDLPRKGLTAQEYTGIIQSYGSIEAYLERILIKKPL